MSDATYHNPYTCNKCTGVNHIFGNLREGEAGTVCQECGFEDYWCYGYFESSDSMLGKCKKYTSRSCPF